MKQFDDWYYKCKSCIHCFVKWTDEEEIHCRCRKGCKYKKAIKKEKENEIAKI